MKHAIIFALTLILGILFTAFMAWVFIKISMSDGLCEMEHDQWVQKIQHDDRDNSLHHQETETGDDLISDDLCQPRNYHYKP